MILNHSAFHSGLAVAIVSILSVPISAVAHTPLPGPPEYSAYGPLQVCTDLYTVNVGVDEAIHVMGDIVRIINDRELIALKIIKRPPGDISGPTKEFIDLANGSSAFRYTLPTPDYAGTLAYSAAALQPKDIRYAIRVSGMSADERLLVGATSFKGDQTDKKTLARLDAPSASEEECFRPDVAVTYTQDHPQWAFYSERKRLFWANFYPPVPDPGPLYYCLGGLGFAVRESEKLRRPWKSLGHAGPATVEIDGTAIRMEGAMRQIKRVDPANAKEHPFGFMRKNSLTYHPSRGVGPPHAAEGVRETGSWEVTLDADYYRGLKISFPAAEKTGVGFSFLERLEFVEEGDARCVSQRGTSPRPPLD